MKMPFLLRLLIFGLIAIIVISAVTAIAAANAIPSTRTADQAMVVGINDLKPSTCAGWYLTSLVIGSGIITGTSENDLILGSSSADMIDGLGGDDCILGGGGDDFTTGEEGIDVCIGGPGADTFATCEAQIQ
jgi:Ca2+-binding RTX toxin-like protein